VMECVIETKSSIILQFIDGLRGNLHLTFEEGTSAAWLYDLLKPRVTRLVVCDPRKNKSMREGNQSDKIDARRLAELLRLDHLSPVYTARSARREQETTGPGTTLPDPLDGSDPGAHLLGILQTPHRFRTKRQLWTYSGLAIETHSSADHRRVNGQLQPAKKQVLVRGLNQNCNHDLKNLFKGAAVVASSKPGPFEGFYAALVARGMRPEMARLTLARKIATIVLIVWKKGVPFDAQHLKPQTA
jgi:hypothetical protein